MVFIHLFISRAEATHVGGKVYHSSWKAYAVIQIGPTLVAVFSSLPNRSSKPSELMACISDENIKEGCDKGLLMNN